MMTRISRFLIPAMMLVCWCAQAEHADAQKSSRPKPTGEVWQIVQLDDAFFPMKKSEIKGYLENIKSAFKDTLREYNADKKRAAKEKREFTEPKPVMQKGRVLKGNFKDKAAAQDEIERIDVYIVVQVDERFDAIRKAALDKYKREAMLEFETALASWESGKKKAKKDKIEFDLPKPKKPKPKALKGSYKTKEEAEKKAKELATKE